MITREMVYEEKRQFVKKLEEALLCLDDIRGIEYRASSSKYIELVRIDWHGEGGTHEYINVTSNNLRDILEDVISLVQEGWAIGQIRDQGRGDKLWEELGNEKKKAPEGYKPNPEYIETKSKRVQLLVQPSVYEAVKAKAKGLGISANEAINEALREYIDRQEAE